MSPKVRLLARELANLLDLARGRTGAPVEASLFLTRRCNSQCSMCDYWKVSTHDSELTTNEIIGIFDQLKRLGVIVLSLSGEGELTLRPDLPLLLSEARNRGFLFSLNSNFLHLSDKNIQAIVDTRPYQVTVGLDTLDPDRYKQIRGMAGGVQRVLANIAKLQAAGYRGVAIGSVILDSNLDDLVKLVQFTTEQGLCGIRFTAFQPNGFGKKWNPEQLHSYGNPDFQKKLSNQIEKLIALKREGHRILNSVEYLRMIPQSFADQFFFPVNCRAPSRRIHIHPTGEVSLCQVVGSAAQVGSTRSSTLKELWRNTSAEAFRNTVKKRGCGGCWLSCYAETNLRFSPRYGLPTATNALRRFFRL